MSGVFTGITTVINGINDNKVLAEIISNIDFDLLKESNQGRPLSINRDDFDLFIARQGRNFIDAGMLDEELVPTNSYHMSTE